MAENITYPYKTYYQPLSNNCNIAYIDEGKGEKTLLFVHGLANYALVWKKNIDYLKQFYRCIAIDLPGNGLSDKNEHPFTMSFFSESLYLFVEALGLKNITIIGHSMGGQITIAAAAKYPQIADKLILCAPAGLEVFSALDKTLYYSTLHMLDFIAPEEQALRKTIENSFYRNHAQGEPVILELIKLMKTYKLNYYKKMVEACIKNMLEEPVYNKLDTLKQPVLIVFGKQDALIPNKMLHPISTEKLAVDGSKKIVDARVKILSDCGHFLQWEKADELNKIIITWLEDNRI